MIFKQRIGFFFTGVKRKESPVIYEHGGFNLKVFFRLLSYSFKYRWRFLSGVIISFFVALLSGISLAPLIPLFDALGDRNQAFEIQFSDSERRILQKAIHNAVVRDKALSPPPLPAAPAKIDKTNATDIAKFLRRSDIYHLHSIESIRLKTVIRWKLGINAKGFSPLEIVIFACLIILPAYFFKLVLLLVSVKLVANTGYMAVRDIRTDLYSAAQRLPLTYFYREKTGLLMSRLINDVEIIAAVISSNLRDAITNIFYIITHLLLLAYINVWLLMISAITLPLILSPVTLFSRKIRKSTHRSQELLGDLNAHLQEAISGVKVIRSFAMEDYEITKFKKITHKLYWRTFKQFFYLQMGPNLVELTSAVVTVGILALGALYLDPVNFTGGDFIAFIAVLLFIVRPIIQLSGMHSKIQAASVAGQRVFEIIDHPPETVDPVNPLTAESLKSEIRFENVHFAYPQTDREVLHGINLTVRAGETVALVGESGGGKSTMMDLLARFFDVTDGRITIDGNDIRDYKVSDHRKRIGIVTQEIFLFYGTILENIAFGQTRFEQEKIEEVARLANAHDFIMEFPDGYQTQIGERGLALSGGQRQRIAIARALLRNPEILILDEATSALDTESERLVQSALEHLFKNRTTFVIAHRLSTIEKANQIFVVSNGEIAERGTHHDLMNRQGLYSHFQEISRQAASMPQVEK